VDTTEAAEPLVSEPKNGAETPTSEPAAPAADKGERGTRAAVSAQIDDFVATVRRLEAFAAEEAKRVSNKLAPQVEHRAKQNIWVTILLALGLGMMFGIWLTGSRRRD